MYHWQDHLPNSYSLWAYIWHQPLDWLRMEQFPSCLHESFEALDWYDWCRFAHVQAICRLVLSHLDRCEWNLLHSSLSIATCSIHWLFHFQRTERQHHLEYLAFGLFLNLTRPLDDRSVQLSHNDQLQSKLERTLCRHVVSCTRSIHTVWNCSTTSKLTISHNLRNHWHRTHTCLWLVVVVWNHRELSLEYHRISHLDWIFDEDGDQQCETMMRHTMKSHR